MLRLAALALAMCFGGLAAGQDARPAPPPDPGGAGGVGPGGEMGGLSGRPTRVPELLARTPEVTRVSSLLGAEILDEQGETVARLDEFAARPDGRLVAILAEPDGTLLGLPLGELMARAKPDLLSGSERVSIRSFQLARVSRRLKSAPEIEDKTRLDDAWLARLDSGNPPSPAGADRDAAPAKSAPPAEPAAPAESGEPADPTEATAPTGSTESAPAPASEAEPAPAATSPPAASGEAEPPPATAPLPLLGALIGRKAVDADGQPVGTIADVVVAIRKAHVAYLVVLQHGEPDGAEALYPVPFEALASGGGDEDVRLTVGALELQNGPRLDGLAKLPVDPFAAAAAPAPTLPPR